MRSQKVEAGACTSQSVANGVKKIDERSYDKAEMENIIEAWKAAFIYGFDLFILFGSILTLKST